VWPATRNKQQQADGRRRLTIVLWAAMEGQQILEIVGKPKPKQGCGVTVGITEEGTTKWR